MLHEYQKKKEEEEKMVKEYEQGDLNIKEQQTKKEDGFVDINNIEVNNHNSYNNIEIPKAKKQSKRKVVKDKVEYNDIETELFAID
jgi:ssDNA-binding Zn-finger/Zn-ribbon topoisomerase 1